MSGDTIQRLQRVVGQADVIEIFLDEPADAGDVGIVDLLVEHRAAVAGVTAAAALRRRCEEQPRAAALRDSQRTVVAGQEAVPRRVARHGRSQERRRRAQDGDVVDQQVQVAFRVGRRGFRGEGVAEQLAIGCKLLKLRGLELEHPMCVEQQQRHAFRRREPEGVQTAGRVVGFAGEAAHQQAIVEGGADHARCIARDAVERVEATGSNERAGRRELAAARRAADGELVDVGQRRQLVDQRVACEQRRRAQTRQIGSRPPARCEIACRVGEAATLSTDCEVEQRAGLRRRLAHVTARARRGLSGGEHAAEFWQDPRRSDRIVEQLLAEIPLRLGNHELRIGASVGKARLRDVGVVHRHHQLRDAADLFVDEAAQLRGAVSLRGGDAAENPGESDRGEG